MSFPPAPTKDPNQLLQNLWGSLRRAATEEWGMEAQLIPTTDGFQMRLRNTRDLGPHWPLVRRYIGGYARASGWVVEGLKKQRGYVEFTARPKKEREERPANLPAGRSADPTAEKTHQ